MSRTLWLHCGSFKAGSSRIQHEAWERREELLARGWLYPETGLVTDEPEIGVRHSRFVYARHDADELRLLVDELVAEVGTSEAGHVLMSSEAWTRPSAAPALAQVVTTLRRKGVVDDVRGVLYLRNRYGYARSFYREMTRRRGNRLTPAGFVEANSGPMDPLLSVDALRGALSPGTLEVVPYEEAGDTATHFFGLLGLDAPPAERRSNTGLPALDVEARRQLNVVAPELAEHWPGLEAALSSRLRLDLDAPESYVERFGPAQLDADEAWRAAFAAATGWSAGQVDALLHQPPPTGHDVTALAGPLRGVVLDWVDRTSVAEVEVTTYPHPQVEVLQLGEVAESGDDPRINGRLLPVAGAGAGWRLVAVDDHVEREARLGRPSPGFGRKHPDRPEAAHAKFTVLRADFGAGGRVDLVLVEPSGARSVLATLRRRFRLR